MIALEVGLNPGPSKHIYKAAALSTMLRLLVNEKANSSPPPLFRLRYVRMNGVTVNHFLFAYISDDGTSCPCSTAVNRFFVYILDDGSSCRSCSCSTAERGQSPSFGPLWNCHHFSGMQHSKSCAQFS